MNNNLSELKKSSIFPDKLNLKVVNKKSLLASFIVFLGLLGITGFWFKSRYDFNDKMTIKLQELSNAEYPANPAPLGKNFQRYSQRKLTIVKKNENTFDFVLEPTNEKTAKIVIKNVDLNLLVPKAPEWVKKDPGLEVIAFTDREWNRQQISFPANSQHIEITGGDGFEKQNVVEVALANNCLNAGFWEILIFNKEDDNKTLYYQSWFTFPMGHYKNIFEKNNNMSYWKHWWKLEHWQDPSGTVINANLLRNVVDEKEIVAQFPMDEKIFSSGEQSRKIRTTLATNLRTWRDIYSGDNKVEFASFIPPGFYESNKPWKNEYWRIAKFEKAVLRNIKSVGTQENLQELELILGDTKTGEKNKLLISGINLQNLPKLAVKDYPKGLYMPLGIGIPPFYQSYEDLKKSHPDKSPYFSVLLDSKDRWIDHHRLALDGVVMHKDQENPNLVHLYFLSYERNTLIAHFLVNLK
ncbi:hypothetical protein H6G54_10060 [Anabaena cylindrica FACHB-243]|uniref:Uncharacterized protein n=1 Tax=Anabaena cylindrica (strain ATCC 27899 / PCC 7122) TaxID=272123 RepID=K9ZFN3_ANACC|nr:MULTISPECIES: hypothetical protein [Anabaena]AFZ57160.1 hypothetical protein Anacy_1660 [Anabaena cylindrica PCC 7122]MBD2418045.1 hypothetical protein [Anabaena cylindrica FACHB-243]MBY5283499.1 hypothetical protein [Anabaena sp. CCAP 1446/1C]MBY5309663.1 hypothetical protein [Anabaena sp. CCAP 1446/1C]MCM2408749.1 hypothetical protein [Anabaena sp. CCAP 1446/1C]